MCCGDGSVTYANSAPFTFEGNARGTQKGVIKKDSPEHPLYAQYIEREKLEKESLAHSLNPVDGSSGPSNNQSE